VTCLLTAEATKGCVWLRFRTSNQLLEDLMAELGDRYVLESQRGAGKTFARLVSGGLKDIGEFTTPKGTRGFGVLFRYLQSPVGGGPAIGGYAIEAFRDGALADVATRELFCSLVYDADAASVTNLDVLLSRVNGVTSVQGTYGQLAIANAMRPGLAGVAVEVSAAGVTPLDLEFAFATPASNIGGTGDILVAECKITSSLNPSSLPDIHSQGIDYLDYLSGKGKDVRLFRFIHNVDPATPGFDGHEADEATKFLRDILYASKQQGAFGKTACKKVVTQLNTELTQAGITGIRSWDPDTMVGTFNDLTRDEKQAATLVRQWFYQFYRVHGLAH
jgi:hypothetical protein